MSFGAGGHPSPAESVAEWRTAPEPERTRHRRRRRPTEWRRQRERIGVRAAQRAFISPVDVDLKAVSQAGKAYRKSQPLHAIPGRKIVQRMRSPPTRKTTNKIRIRFTTIRNTR